MLSVSGYRTLNLLYESSNSEVYRAIRETDEQPVILKLLKEDYPTPSELRRYKQEYELTHSTHLSGVVKAYDLQPYKNTLVIILEDFGGESLRTWQENQPEFKLHHSLSLFIKTADSLGQLHAENIIHKDINPANLVFNPQTQELKIIDLGISTQLSKENPRLKNPTTLEGTLPYISPEQTGRMNRSLDYRTDFYSLGVTFYELLTHQLPFTTQDELELVHCHIAREPASVSEINPQIPPILSDIISKLMAKNAEDRYQSAWGLKADLETCLTQLENQGKIDPFPLGRQDLSDKFQIPQKLYGRQNEIEQLLTTFEQVDQHSQMMLVAGYSGIGKSALVQEIYKPITQRKGYFIAGKFDQFQRNVPYSAMVSAFKGFVQQLLTENPESLEQWKTKFLHALGVNGQVIIDVIPEIELIIGPQPPIDQLGPTESQNRFNLVFQSFIRSCCSPEHPLVLFLDDLQWTDGATLKLIELIVTDKDLKHLFLIGAYRDNEVSDHHPLILLINKLKQGETFIEQVTLTNLDLEDVNHLLQDTVKTAVHQVHTLGELIVSKTGGNPFFVNQFLSDLDTENFITFDYNQQAWTWDLQQISSQDITDNVVELMIRKLRKLPLKTQEALKLAACIGANFDLQTLSIVAEESKQILFTDLVTAVQSELILSLSDLDDDLLIQEYRFLHDRVQQAAYELIPQENKQLIHLKIGQLLLHNTSVEEQEERLFDIVGHLNIGLEKIIDKKEKIEVIQLNLKAGQRAKLATAYEGALEYLNLGINALDDNSWTEHYSLTFAIHKERCEVEYLCGNFQQAQNWAYRTLEQTQSILEKCEIYGILTLQNCMLGQYTQAFIEARKGLELLGVYFPESQASAEELKAALQIEVDLVNQHLETHSVLSLKDAPEIQDPEKRMIGTLLCHSLPATFFNHQLMWRIVIAKSVNLFFSYGVIVESTCCLGSYAMFLASDLEDYALSYKFGEAGVKVGERFGHGGFKCQALHLFATYVNGWNKPLASTNILNHQAFTAGLESGDFLFSGYTLMMDWVNLFCQGKTFDQIEKTLETYLSFTEDRGNRVAHDLLLGCYLAFYNLTGSSSEITVFDTPRKTEEDYVQDCLQYNSYMGLCYFYIFKAQTLYLYEQYSQALEVCQQANERLTFISISLGVAQQNLYHSLTFLALYPKADLNSQTDYLEKVKQNQVRMKRWADNCPDNFLNKFLLVEAELARCTGKVLEAMNGYDRSIQLAKENGLIQEEALANELAGKFYLELDKPQFASLYIQQAHYLYSLWGAQAKVGQLEERYPELFDSGLSKQSQMKNTVAVTRTSSGKDSNVSLDLSTVMKANQAISGEIVLENLMSALMDIILQNAGGQTGYLLIYDRDELIIEASKIVNSSQIDVLQAIPVEEYEKIPKMVINYVYRTQESVVLNDASNRGNFMNDPYIQDERPKSILCVPLINQGKLVSIVYLENNLTTGAFTANRVEMIKLLSGQAAIALENAYLYQNLEKKVQERTAELAIANQEIGVLNEKLKAENLRLSSELDVAKKLQQMVLPKAEELEDIIGLEIAGYMEPADEVGGDYYDVLKQGERLKIGIGDVTGHGLESGVLMLMAQTAIRTLQKVNETDPVRFLDLLNQTLYDNLQRMNSDKNMTLAILDYHEGRVQLSGQHEEAIVVRSNGEIELIDTIDLGFPIGLDDQIAAFISQQDIHLNAEDVMVLYTDGITEAANGGKDQYGLERLCNVVIQHRQQSAYEIRERVIEDVRGFIGDYKVFDDITLVVLKQR